MIKFERKRTPQPALFGVVKIYLLFSLLSSALLLLTFGGVFLFNPTEQVTIEVSKKVDDLMEQANLTVKTITGVVEIPVQNYFQYFWYSNGLGGEFATHPIHLLTNVLILYLLYAIIQKLDYKKPFTSYISRRIYWLAYLVLLDVGLLLLRKMSVFRFVRSQLGNEFIYSIPGTGALDSAWAMGFRYGFMLLIVAMVYRRGLQLAREQDLVI